MIVNFYVIGTPKRDAFLTLLLAWDLLLGGFVELVCFPLLWKRARGLVMDDRIRREVSEFVMGLSTSQQEKLAAAGTLIDIEKLTAEIGDEVARQLANLELSRRSDALCEQPTHACPDCGKACRIEPDLEPIILQGMRGEIEYAEPRCPSESFHCGFALAMWPIDRAVHPLDPAEFETQHSVQN
jgi:hypothetical protein